MLNTDPDIIRNGAKLLGAIYVPLFLAQIVVSLLRKKPVEWVRVTSMVVLYGLIFLSLILPPVTLVVFASLLGVLAVREIYTAATFKDPDNVRPFFRYFSYTTAVILPVIFYVAPNRVPPFLILSVGVLFAYPVFSQDPTRALDRSSRALMGLIFQTMTSHLILIRVRPDGIAVCLFLFYLINITDIGAYTFGRFLGSRKLSPSISSGKTVEGSILATLVAVGIGVLFHQVLLAQYSTYKIVVVSLALALIAQLGDLILSVFKRDVGIKDYSHLIPGQGGILDRFDSLILCIPALYYLLEWMQ